MRTKLGRLVDFGTAMRTFPKVGLMLLSLGFSLGLLLRAYLRSLVVHDQKKVQKYNNSLTHDEIPACARMTASKKGRL